MQIINCYITEPDDNYAFCSKLSTFIVNDKFFKFRSGDLDELPDVDVNILLPIPQNDTLYIKDDSSYYIYNIKEDLVYEAFGYNSDLHSIDDILNNPELNNNTPKDSYKIFINHSLCPIENQNIKTIAKSHLSTIK